MQIKNIIAILLILMGTFLISDSIIPSTDGTETAIAEETETAEEKRMVQEIIKATGMNESKARSLSGYIVNAGLEDATNFTLKKNAARDNYELSFEAGGKTYTAVLSRLMLLEQIKDDQGVTIFALIL